MSKTQIALITGGSRGLGRNTAVSLARTGVDSIITYQSNASAAAETVAEIERLGRTAVALALDAGNVATFGSFAAAVQNALAERWGAERFDFLVNNAGGSLHAAFADTTEAQFDAIIGVHVKGVYFLTQTLLPLINDGGRIVNVSSGLARFAFAGSSAYAAAKGAVEVLTRYLAVELGPRKIAVNTVAPGAIATDFGGGLVRDNPELNARIASLTALGRAGQPDDVGPAVAALLSDANRWVNAQRIEISGGMML